MPVLNLESPWIAGPLALGGLLALARSSRRNPRLRPLLLPFAMSAVAVFVIALLGWPPLSSAGVLALLPLLPLLVLLVRASGLLFDHLFQRSQGEPPPALLDSLLSVLLYGVGGGAILHYVFGFELTPFLATSAVVGAVVGLALQETLGNLFTGIALHSAAPFRVGDWARLGTHEGRIEQVSWRAVRLRTWNGDKLTVPNNEVARHAIENYSMPAEPHSRIVLIGVNYHTPPNKVISVLRKLLEQIPEVVAEPESVIRIVAYLDSAIQYEVRYYLRRYEDYRTIEGEIFRLIWYHFRRHGIEIPFPIRNVYVHKVEGGAEVREAPATRLERALRSIDLFRPLSDEELAAVAARFRLAHYASGEKLIEEGSPGDSFFVIDSGEVEVARQFGGVRRTLARLMEGQFFGEIALLTGEPRSASVVALTDVDVFTIDKAGFKDVLAANPAIAADVSTILSERREALSQAAGDITGRLEPAPASRRELKDRLLDRIRSYFGL
jgi:small-conductance mechanosensitive channel/CRP-like cAMP-binding protein